MVILSEVRVSNINLLIAEIEVVSHDTVLACLSLIFIYVLWRYWLYWRFEPLKLSEQQQWTQYLLDKELKYFFNRVRSSMEAFEVPPTHHNFPAHQNRYQATSRAVEILDLERDSVCGVGRRIRELEVWGGNDGLEDYFREPSGYEGTSLEQLAKNIEIQGWKVFIDNSGPRKDTPRFIKRVEYSMPLLLMRRMAWRIRFAWEESHFSDLHLPFIFACVGGLVSFFGMIGR